MEGEPAAAQMPLQTGGGSVFRKLVLFSGVGREINKNKQTSRCRRMGGGVAPACPLRRQLARLKVAASSNQQKQHPGRPAALRLHASKFSNQACVVLAVFLGHRVKKPPPAGANGESRRHAAARLPLAR